MALIKCSKCGGTVSTKAAACPHCDAVPADRLLENQRPEKLANELGSMPEARSQLEPLPTSSPQNILQSAIPENSAFAAHPTQLKQKKQDSTGDIILYSILWIAMAIFFVPASCILINSYFREPDTLRATTGSGNGLTIDPSNWGLSGKDLPEGVIDSRTLPKPGARPFGTRPEHYSLDQYMRKPMPKGPMKAPPPP